MAIRKSKVDPLPRTPHFEFVNLKSFKNKPSGYRLTKIICFPDWHKIILFSGLSQRLKYRTGVFASHNSLLHVTSEYTLSRLYRCLSISWRYFPDGKGNEETSYPRRRYCWYYFAVQLKLFCTGKISFKVQWINCNLVWLFCVLKKNQSVVCCLIIIMNVLNTHLRISMRLQFLLRLRSDVSIIRRLWQPL